MWMEACCLYCWIAILGCLFVFKHSLHHMYYHSSCYFFVWRWRLRLFQPSANDWNRCWGVDAFLFSRPWSVRVTRSRTNVDSKIIGVYAFPVLGRAIWIYAVRSLCKRAIWVQYDSSVACVMLCYSGLYVLTSDSLVIRLKCNVTGTLVHPSCESMIG